MKKFLAILFIFSLFYLNAAYGKPNIYKYINSVFEFFISNKVQLDPEVKKYLREKIQSDNDIGSFDYIKQFNLGHLNKSTVYNDAIVRMVKLSPTEMEVLLYRFYEKGYCEKDNNTLRFFYIVLNNVIDHKQAVDSPKFDPRLRFFLQERQKIKSIIKQLLK